MIDECTYRPTVLCSDGALATPCLPAAGVSRRAATPDDPHRLLDIRQLSARLGVSVRTIYRMADVGQLPPGVRVGKQRRWDWRAVKAHLAGHATARKKG